MTEQDRKEFEAWAKSMRLNVKRSACDGSFWSREAKYAYLAWLAARRTQDAKVRELVEAVEELLSENRIFHLDSMDVDSYMTERLGTLAAKLKGQDDE